MLVLPEWLVTHLYRHNGMVAGDDRCSVADMKGEQVS